jgi:hypothetical protein
MASCYCPRKLRSVPTLTKNVIGEKACCRDLRILLTKFLIAVVNNNYSHVDVDVVFFGMYAESIFYDPFSTNRITFPAPKILYDIKAFNIV